MWNQSQGVLGEDGRGHVAVGVGDVAGAVPLEQHPAGPDVDLLDEAVDDPLVGGAADGGQVRGRHGIGRDQRGVPGRDEELVEVGRVPVARPDRGDLLVTVVVDVVGAAGTVRADLGLPGPLGRLGPRWPAGLEPGQDRLAQVGLSAEVGGNFPGGQPVEPDHLPGGGDDLRARRVAASGRGDEDVPVAAAGVAGQHGERRRRGAGRHVTGMEPPAGPPTGPREHPETHATARAQAAPVTRTARSRGRDGRLPVARSLPPAPRPGTAPSRRRASGIGRTWHPYPHSTGLALNGVGAQRGWLRALLAVQRGKRPRRRSRRALLGNGPAPLTRPRQSRPEQASTTHGTVSARASS